MAPRVRNMPGADVGPTYSKSLILKGPKMGRVSKNGCFEKFWRTLSKKFHFFSDHSSDVWRTSAGRPSEITNVQKYNANCRESEGQLNHQIEKTFSFRMEGWRFCKNVFFLLKNDNVSNFARPLTSAGRPADVQRTWFWAKKSKITASRKWPQTHSVVDECGKLFTF